MANSQKPIVEPNTENFPTSYDVVVVGAISILISSGVIFFFSPMIASFIFLSPPWSLVIPSIYSIFFCYILIKAVNDWKEGKFTDEKNISFRIHTSGNE